MTIDQKKSKQAQVVKKKNKETRVRKKTSEKLKKQSPQKKNRKEPIKSKNPKKLEMKKRSDSQANSNKFGEKVQKKGMKKKKKRNPVLILIMLIGFCIFAYPFISNGYYKWIQQQANQAYFEETGKLDQKNQVAIKDEMAAYNKRLANEKYQELEMPFLKAQRENLTGSKSQELGEVLAVVEIPTIRVELPVYNGTSDLQLQYGAGLLHGTSMPIGGENSHSVITGHRGLPSAKLFTDLPKLKMGDQFYLHLQEDTHAYEVDQIKVIEPTEMDNLKIIPGEDYVTLLTCTPYMINTHRLLVRGHLIPYEKTKRLQAINEAKVHFWIEMALYLLGALIVLALVIWRKKRKQQKKRAKVKGSKSSKRIKGRS